VRTRASLGSIFDAQSFLDIDGLGHDSTSGTLPRYLLATGAPTRVCHDRLRPEQVRRVPALRARIELIRRNPHNLTISVSCAGTARRHDGTALGGGLDHICLRGPSADCRDRLGSSKEIRYKHLSLSFLCDGVRVCTRGAVLVLR